MNLPHFFAKNMWYIMLAATAISVVNLPIQIMQLAMLTKLTFPQILPIQMPWWVFFGGGLCLMLILLAFVGYILVRINYVKIQSDLSTQHNPQIVEILEYIRELKNRERMGDE